MPCAAATAAGNTCAHGGTLRALPMPGGRNNGNNELCMCSCAGNWGGAACDECQAQDCAHGGVLDASACACVCPPPWVGDDHCATCTPLACGHGGVFDPTTCSCTCTGSWRGELCDTCALASGGRGEALCGRRGVDWDACACHTACPPTATCLHGGVVDAATCGCTCNVAAAGSGGAAKAGRGVDMLPRFAALDDAATRSPPRRLRHSAASFVEVAAEQQQSSPSSSSPLALAVPLPAPVAPLAPAAIAASEARLAESGVAVGAPTPAAWPLYWAGDRCDVCLPPAVPCGPGSTLSMEACGCVPVCAPDLCQHGGTPVLLYGIDAGGNGTSSGAGTVAGTPACGCRCPVGWSGSRCDVVASGATAASAGRSCLAIKRVRPKAGSGRYWINPTGVAPLQNAFQVVCDMAGSGTGGDIGGWTQVATVGSRLRHMLLDGGSYRQGVSAGGGVEHILPCARFDGLDGAPLPRPPALLRPLSRFILRVRMGSVVDYFTGSDAASLCDVLASSQRHLWAPAFVPAMGRGATGVAHDLAAYAKASAAAAAALRSSDDAASLSRFRAVHGGATAAAGGGGDAANSDAVPGGKWVAPVIHRRSSSSRKQHAPPMQLQAAPATAPLPVGGVSQLPPGYDAANGATAAVLAALASNSQAAAGLLAPALVGTSPGTMTPAMWQQAAQLAAAALAAPQPPMFVELQRGSAAAAAGAAAASSTSSSSSNASGAAAKQATQATDAAPVSPADFAATLLDGVPLPHHDPAAAAQPAARDTAARATSAAGVLLETASDERRAATTARRASDTATGAAAPPPTADAPWLRPAYIDLALNPQLHGVLGGCAKDWPRGWDGRQYIALWGGNRGGCCHAAAPGVGAPAGGGAWGREFDIAVQEVDPPLYAWLADGGDLSDLRLAPASGEDAPAAALLPGGASKDEADPLEVV